MTLSTQNKLLLWFSALSTLTGIAFIIGIVFFVFRLSALDLPTITETSIMQFITEENQIYTLLPYMIFSLYVPIVGFSIYHTFEKTKSPEMLYFISMLIGFFAQSFFLCIPIFSLYTGYSSFLSSISSIAFFGQMQVMLSVLFQGALVTQDESRDSDKFVGIISIVSLSFSAIIPVDVTNIAQDFSPTYAFESVFLLIRVVFTIIAFASMILSSASKKSRDYRCASIAFLFLCTGYLFLTSSATLLFLCIGFLFFSVGTIRFLKHLHWYYMWK